MNANDQTAVPALWRQVIEDDDIAPSSAAFKATPDHRSARRRIRTSPCRSTAGPCRRLLQRPAALHLAAAPSTSVPARPRSFRHHLPCHANAVRLHGGTSSSPTSDRDTGLMRPAKILPKPKPLPHGKADALFNVHLAGQCGDIAAIYHLAAPALAHRRRRLPRLAPR